MKHGRTVPTAGRHRRSRQHGRTSSATTSNAAEPALGAAGSTPPVSRSLAKTIAAVLWMYGGRGIGMLWTLAIVAELGIGDYGRYGMAFALAAVIGPPLDNPFNIRAMRESRARFLAERTTRYLMGLTLVLAGLAATQISYILWFGLVVAGSEVIVNTCMSQSSRDGHPQRVWRMGTIRQTASVVLGCGYLLAFSAPTLEMASALYCLPYAVFVVAGALLVFGHKPGLPGHPKLMAALSLEMLGTCLYLQGDVLMLGWLTNDEVVGYYALTTTVAVSLAAVGQAFGMSYHESLRKGMGALSAGPRLRMTLLLGVVTGALVLITGLVLLFAPVARELAIAMLLMAVFCAMRTVSSVFQVVLYAQRRDLLRVTANLTLVPVKLGLVAALATAGAVGAATATVITDAILLTVYSLALYGRRWRRTPEPQTESKSQTESESESVS